MRDNARRSNLPVPEVASLRRSRELGEGVFGNACTALETCGFQIHKKHVEPLKELYIKNAYENKGFPYTDSATVPSQTFESTQVTCCLPCTQLGSRFKQAGLKNKAAHRTAEAPQYCTAPLRQVPSTVRSIALGSHGAPRD